MAAVSAELKALVNFYAGSDFSNQCHAWQGPFLQGRPILRYKRQTLSSRRLIYQMYWGVIDKKYVVIQTCNNQKCINPRHLKAVSRTYLQTGQPSVNRVNGLP